MEPAQQSKESSPNFLSRIKNIVWKVALTLAPVSIVGLYKEAEIAIVVQNLRTTGLSNYSKCFEAIMSICN